MAQSGRWAAGTFHLGNAGGRRDPGSSRTAPGDRARDRMTAGDCPDATNDGAGSSRCVAGGRRSEVGGRRSEESEVRSKRRAQFSAFRSERLTTGNGYPRGQAAGTSADGPARSNHTTPNGPHPQPLSQSWERGERLRGRRLFGGGDAIRGSGRDRAATERRGGTRGDPGEFRGCG